MALPLHLGIEHPNLVWVLATGLLAFVVGLGVNLYRSLDDSRGIAPRAPEDESE